MTTSYIVFMFTHTTGMSYLKVDVENLASILRENRKTPPSNTMEQSPL